MEILQNKYVMGAIIGVMAAGGYILGLFDIASIGALFGAGTPTP